MRGNEHLFEINKNSHSGCSDSDRSPHRGPRRRFLRGGGGAVTSWAAGPSPGADNNTIMATLNVF